MLTKMICVTDEYEAYEDNVDNPTQYIVDEGYEVPVDNLRVSPWGEYANYDFENIVVLYFQDVDVNDYKPVMEMEDGRKFYGAVLIASRREGEFVNLSEDFLEDFFTEYQDNERQIEIIEDCYAYFT